MYQKYTGIILKKHPLGEADELLTIYTKEQGKLRAKAPGTRKIKSRLAGSLQSLNEIEFETALPHGIARLPVIISVRVVRLNNFLREDLKKFACVLVGAETLYRLAPDGQESQNIYRVLLELLQDMDRNHSLEIVMRLFQLKLLRLFGYGFDVKSQPLNSEEKKQLGDLWEGKRSENLSKRAGRAIEQAVHNVLEREVRANRFLETLNQE